MISKYQSTAVNDILLEFSKGAKHVCLAHYTGSGKTNVFLEMCKQLIKKNSNVRIGISAYITKEIRDQTLARAIQFQLPSEISDKDSISSSDKQIFIFNPQAVYRAKSKKKFDYFIIDEAHVGMEESLLMINSILKNLCSKKTKILMVTATPWDVISQPRFKNIKILKRSFADGLKDGRVADVELITEENGLVFTKKDFGKSGDLKAKTAIDHFDILKSMCLGKMKSLINKYGDDLGKSVLVVCPPGNTGEIARSLAKYFKGVTFTESIRANSTEQQENLDAFKAGKYRFLFVVYKCSVGFDMPHLDTIIDLTMTRNVKTVVQRIGRVARKNGDQKKKYIYVYDKNMGGFRLEWLIATCIDFSMGNYDGWNTRNVCYKNIEVSKSFSSKVTRKDRLFITDVIKAISKNGAVKTTVKLQYTESKKPTFRTLKMAIEEAKQYSDRHTLFKENPSLYKWFRVYGHLAELNKIHSPRIRKWTEELVLEKAREVRSRGEFKLKFNGAYSWLVDNKKIHLLHDLYPSKILRQSISLEGAKEFIRKNHRKFKGWTQVRNSSLPLRRLAESDAKIKNELLEFLRECKRGDKCG